MHPAETVARYYETVDAGDVEGVLALFTEDAVYARPGYAPFEGHEALRAFYAGDRVIESGRHTVEHMVVQDDGAAEPRVAVHGRFEGRLKDGSDASLRFADFYTFAADGRFASRDTFFFAPLV